MRSFRFVVAILAVSVALMGGCSKSESHATVNILGPSENPTPTPTPTPTPGVDVTGVLVSTPYLELTLGACPAIVAFTATVIGTGVTQTVTWDPMTNLVPTGERTATLSISAPGTYIVTARSTQNPGRSGSVTVQVNGTCAGGPGPGGPGPGGPGPGGPTIQRPIVTLVPNPPEIERGGTSIISMTVANNADRCDLVSPYRAQLPATGGEFPVSPALDTTYIVECSNAAGTGTASTMVSVRASSTPVVISPPSLTLTAPGVNCSGNTGQFTANQAVTWSSSNTNVAQINASGFVTAVAAGSATITATNASGQTATAQVIVNACTGPSAPTCSLTPSATSITQGGSVTFSWTYANTTQLTATGSGWSGARSLTATTETLTMNNPGTYTFGLTCTGNGGTAQSNTVTVVVNLAPAPTCTLVPSVTSVAQGGSVTLTWSSMNATEVVPTAGWTGTFGLSGSRTVVLAATTDFGIECRGPGGRTPATTRITVTGPDCPSVIDYTPAGGTIAVNQVRQLTVSNWPSSSSCQPFWYVSDPSRAQINGGDTMVIINGQTYYGGIHGNLRGVFPGSVNACVQTSLVTPQVLRCYTWTVVAADEARAMGLDVGAPIPVLRYMNVEGVAQTFRQP